MRTSLGIKDKGILWALRAGTRGVPQSSKQHDLVNCAFATQVMTVRKTDKHATIEECVKDFYVDVNPSIYFKPWGHMKGMQTGSSYYSFEFARMLVPQEHFKMLGWPLEKLKLERLSRAEINDLTGNGQCLLQTAAVLYALFLTVELSDLWQDDRAPDPTNWPPLLDLIGAP